MDRFTRTSGLLLLALGFCLAPALFAQEAPPPKASPSDVAKPDSQSEARPLRDPTRPSAWRPSAVVGARSGPRLPPLKLRGRVLSKRGATGLLAVGDELHLLRPGDSLSLSLERASLPRASRSSRRAAPPAPQGTLSVTLRVLALDAQGLRLEVPELNRTITLR